MTDSSGGTDWGALALIAGGSLFVWYYVKIKLRLRRIRKFTEKYGDREIAVDIANKKIWQGMTEEMLADSWGGPAEIDKKVLKTKTKKTFKYNRTGKNSFRDRVIAEDGIVVGWDLKGR